MLRPSFGYLVEPDQSVGSTVAHTKPRCLIRTNCDFLALTVPPWKRLPHERQFRLPDGTIANVGSSLSGTFSFRVLLCPGLRRSKQRPDLANLDSHFRHAAAGHGL